ncbi:hypothetical protein [Dechloromonas sp. HYN0024]|uniref:hypothetical protein n=1 Tax=Dechloromonas sp. HYN0024 TaxID=2231055 RepID=UPI000E44E47C|nr:hypothetical protein [Dechloromonas sp. HYN0024]AXS79858.1 hypothetical protein HYN24_07410 [Dechloromonas sp. HYN0024]
MVGLQIYDFTLAPNQTRELAAEGQYFRYYAGSAGGADETILIKSDTGGVQTLLRPGQSIKTPTNCRSWYLSNYKNAGTIMGFVVVGNGEIQDSQVAGTVSIINGELVRVKSNACFIGAASNAGAAGNYSMTQLWNPAGSGKNLILNKVSLYTVTAAPTGVGLARHNAALATLQGNGTTKFIGAGTASVGELRNTNAAAIIGTTIGAFSISLANESKDFPFSEPVAIQPGNGIIMWSASLNNNLQTTFQWNEEAV